jgi:hypothetical protein
LHAGDLGGASPEGRELWKEAFDCRLTESPAVSPDGGVYLAALDRHVYHFKTLEQQIADLSSERGGGRGEPENSKKIELSDEMIIIDGLKLRRQ